MIVPVDWMHTWNAILFGSVIDESCGHSVLWPPHIEWSLDCKCLFILCFFEGEHLFQSRCNLFNGFIHGVIPFVIARNRAEVFFSPTLAHGFGNFLLGRARIEEPRYGSGR